MKIQLIVVQGKPEGKVIPITVPVFRIGRGPNCQMRPNSEQVSREHAEIEVKEGQVTLRDLGSRNGTFLNGKSLTGVFPLKNGDVVQIGPLTFAISIQGASATGVAEPSPTSDSREDVTSWLVADAAHATPESPSGVYGGDTMTLQAYKGAVAPDSQPSLPAGSASKPTASPPKSATAPAAKPAVGPTAAPAPVPTPSPSASAPAAKAAAAPPPVSPPASSAPTAPSAKPAPAAQPIAPAPEHSSHWDHLEFEPLPEGEGDAPQESFGSDQDAVHEDGETSDAAEEELLDPSNPFYVAKNQQKDEGSGSKPAYKDTSDAAADVLRKLMDRRRASKG